MDDMKYLVPKLEEAHKSILSGFRSVLSQHGFDDLEVIDFNVARSDPRVAALVLRDECPPGQQLAWRCHSTGTGIRCGWRCE